MVSEKNKNLIIYLLISFFVLIKFLLINYTPLSTDEGQTYRLIFSELSVSEILTFIRVHDTQMPLFYLWAIFFKQFDFVRFPLTVIACLIPFVPFFLGLKGKKWLLFSVLLSISYFSFRHAANFRPYILMYFEATLFLCGLELCKEGAEKKGRCLIVISLFLLIFTHYYGLLAFFVFCFNELFVMKKPYFNRNFLIGAIGLAVISLLPFITDIWRDFNAVHVYRLPIGYLDLLKALVLQLNGAIATTFVGIVALLYWRDFLDTCRKYHEYLVYACLSFLLAYMKSILTSPAFDGTYFIFVSPFVLLVLSDFLLKLKNFFILIAIFSLLSLLFNYRDLSTRVSASSKNTITSQYEIY